MMVHFGRTVTGNGNNTFHVSVPVLVVSEHYVIGFLQPTTYKTEPKPRVEQFPISKRSSSHPEPTQVLLNLLC